MIKSINTTCLFLFLMFFTLAGNKLAVKSDFSQIVSSFTNYFFTQRCDTLSYCLWTIALYTEAATVESVRSMRGQVNLPHTITLTQFSLISPGDFTTYTSNRGGVSNAHWAEISFCTVSSEKLGQVWLSQWKVSLWLWNAVQRFTLMYTPIYQPCKCSADWRFQYFTFKRSRFTES